jgi:hypothetical protein
VYSFRLRGDQVARAEERARGDSLDLSGYVNRAIDQANTRTEQADMGSALVVAKQETAAVRAELAEARLLLRRISRLAAGEEPAPTGKAAVVADLADRTEQIAPGSVKFRSAGTENRNGARS